MGMLSARPEGPTDAIGPKDRERGMGSWGGDSKLPPHQLEGLGERCKLLQWGPGQSHGKH